LVEEIVKDKLSVARLRERIKETSAKQPTYITAEKVPANIILEQQEPKKLEGLKKTISDKISAHETKLEQYKADKARIEEVIKKMPTETRQRRTIGFRDWTNVACNVNIQTGCQNECGYCYAKTLSYQRKQKELGSWGDQTLRPEDVDKPRHLYYGLVGFPSTHDVNKKNIGNYLYVLGKLLRAGNDVLIVSKPDPDCIKRICDASIFFKDKILFRFTICAMDNAILKLWEPNAPTYEMRKEALKIARDMRFETSVSMEPMLDTPNTKAMIDDLLPLVTKDIWIGQMNHLQEILKSANEDQKADIERIKANQTKEKLMEIHEAIKDNPNIQWKSETYEMLGLKKTPAAGMDQ